MIATTDQIPYVDLGGQFEPLKEELMAAIEEVMASGWFILGPNVEEFEQKFAELSGTKYAIGVGNGTDALSLPMKALGIGPGDEVIVPPNSYLASASSVALIGATPVFADVDENYNINPDEVRKKITSKTKGIMAVHLTGRPARMHELKAIADEHGLILMEDSAQAIGAKYDGKPIGGFGHFSGFSLHPLKNLNAAGDAGVITTNDKDLYEHMLKARTHGHSSRNEVDFWSLNTRLDAIQAAILLVKMKHLDTWTNLRRRNAAIYQERLADKVWVPTDADKEFGVYHTFIIQTDRRDALQQHLTDHGVGTAIHYPIPIHLQKAAEYLGYKRGDMPVTERHCDTILSLPIFHDLTETQVNRVCDVVLDFFA